MDSRQRVVIDFVELGFMRRIEMGLVEVPVMEGRSSETSMVGTVDEARLLGVGCWTS